MPDDELVNDNFLNWSMEPEINGNFLLIGNKYNTYFDEISTEMNNHAI